MCILCDECVIFNICIIQTVCLMYKKLVFKLYLGDGFIYTSIMCERSGKDLEIYSVDTASATSSDEHIDLNDIEPSNGLLHGLHMDGYLVEELLSDDMTPGVSNTGEIGKYIIGIATISCCIFILFNVLKYFTLSIFLQNYLVVKTFLVFV